MLPEWCYYIFCKGDENMQTKLLILRKQHKESQKDLAKLLNISEKAYGDKERGKYMFDADEMWILSRHYHKTMDDIFLPSSYQNGNKDSDYSIEIFN